MTSKFCVVGSPINHSLSPVIHQAAYSHLGIEFLYERHEVQSGGLRKFVDLTDFAGLSVTMPLKVEAYSLSDSPSKVAAQTGVANTLVRSGSGWIAHNTDVFGISQCIKSALEVNQVIVLGSGATARSALVAISDVFPVAEISIIARNADTAGELAEFGGRLSNSTTIARGSVDELLGADLVISTVPAAAYEQLWTELARVDDIPNGLLLDVAYNPWPSLAARSWGESCVSGLEMLIWQAVQQVHLFAESQNIERQIDPQEIYAVMKAAVTESS